MKTLDHEGRSYFYRFYAYLEGRNNDNIIQGKYSELFSVSTAGMTDEEKAKAAKA